MGLDRAQGLRHVLRAEEPGAPSGGSSPPPSGPRFRGDKAGSFVWPAATPALRHVLDLAAAIGVRLRDIDLSYSSMLFALVASGDPAALAAFEGLGFLESLMESPQLNGVKWSEIEALARETPARDPELSYPVTVSARQFLETAERFARQQGRPDEQIDTRHLVAVYLFAPGTHDADLARYGLDRAQAALAFLRFVRGQWPSEFEAWCALDASAFGRDARASLDPAATPAPAPAPAPAIAERVSPHADDPAQVDALSRRAFAQVIGARIEEVAGLGPGAGAGARSREAFAVHLHGPWGAGKTSIFNFLREDLQSPAREPSRRWVVVDFNAWRQQRLRPPWWTLLKEIYTQSARQLDGPRSLLLRLQWVLWRARADWLPTAFTVALIAVALMFGVGAFNAKAPAPLVASAANARAAAPVPSPASAAASEPRAGAEAQGKAIEQWLQVFMAVIAASAALLTFSRTLVFGSGRAAQAYVDLRADPLRPIVTLFHRLIRGIDRPVAVFIDDLDRCEDAFVVDLLEGLQTLFRGASVTYVVAADRKWIASSFEHKYEHFGTDIGEPGRPLGYLFLDKIFQVSTAVPLLSHELQARYFRGLLKSTADDDAPALEQRLQHAEAKAAAAVQGSVTHEALQQRIVEAHHDPDLEQAVRAAAAKQMTGAAAQVAAEHRLQPLAPLLEPNPRAMKRLVNAYAMSQAAHYLDGRDVPPEALARWTILEQRWPLLAEHLVQRPHLVAVFGAPVGPVAAGAPVPLAATLPPGLAALAENEAVIAVVGRVGAGDAGALDEARVREITGQRPKPPPPSQGA